MDPRQARDWVAGQLKKWLTAMTDALPRTTTDTE